MEDASCTAIVPAISGVGGGGVLAVHPDMLISTMAVNPITIKYKNPRLIYAPGSKMKKILPYLFL
jgi:hypothetical protein